MTNETNNMEKIAFADCYKMTANDIEAFANCLAKGFSGYPLFDYVSGNKYNEKKMKNFWIATLKTAQKQALCYANDADVKSVLIYFPPKCKEPGFIEYIRNNCLKEIFSVGFFPVYRLVHFNNIAHRISDKYISDKCGYLMAIATLPDKQKSGHGKKLLNSLISYLHASDQDCYLETLKAGNVALYEHFGFKLKETSHLLATKLPIFGMVYNSDTAEK